MPRHRHTRRRSTLNVAYWAVMLLGRFGGMSVPAQPQIVSALTAALDRHAEIAVRQQAAWALGKFGVAANSARESLSQAAACGDPRLAPGEGSDREFEMTFDVQP